MPGCDIRSGGDMVTRMDGADSDLISSITPDVMTCLRRSLLFERLDDLLSPKENSHPREVCAGNYEWSKRLLEVSGFDADDVRDIFNVLRAQGGCCDCEILYNVAESSRLKSEYWKSQAEGVDGRKKHPGTAQ
jgi:uncharacterized protein DUF2695